MQKRHLPFLAAMLLPVLVAGAVRWQETLFAQQKAERAPEFQLRDLRGRLVSLTGLLKKSPVLLDFWALWCNPCLKELPHLNDIQEAYKEKLRVVAVNEDDASNQAKIRPFVKGNRYRFQVLLDPDHLVMRRFKLNAIPTTFLIDQRGKMVFFHQGYQPGDEKLLSDAVAGLLNRKISSPPDSSGR